MRLEEIKKCLKGLIVYMLISVCAIIFSCNKTNSAYDCKMYEGLSEEEIKLLYKNDSAFISYIHKLNAMRDTIKLAHTQNDEEKAYNGAWGCVLADDEYNQFVGEIRGKMCGSHEYDSVKTWFPEVQKQLDAHFIYITEELDEPFQRWVNRYNREF